MPQTMKALNRNAVIVMESDFSALFNELFRLQVQIKRKLVDYADGKNLKGYELVGWLGEIYVKLLLDGRLVADAHEHDVETEAGWRISVKTRRGNGKGWTQSSSVPRFEGELCPTHLAFVHLNNDYTIDRIWLFPWSHLCETNRFNPKFVRGRFRSYVFKLNEKNDQQSLIYDAKTVTSKEPRSPYPRLNDS